jgi:hypothetical protein
MEEVEMYEEVLLSLVDNEIIQAGMCSVPNLTLFVAEIGPCRLGYSPHSLGTILTELVWLLYYMQLSLMNTVNCV